MRHGRRYASDMTDREWALIEPLMPEHKATGRPRTTALRDVMDAILYLASTGCQWAMLPNDFPPPSTVQRYFYDWAPVVCWTASTIIWSSPRVNLKVARPVRAPA